MKILWCLHCKHGLNRPIRNEKMRASRVYIYNRVVGCQLSRHSAAKHPTTQPMWLSSTHNRPFEMKQNVTIYTVKHNYLYNVYFHMAFSCVLSFVLFLRLDSERASNLFEWDSALDKYYKFRFVRIRWNVRKKTLNQIDVAHKRITLPMHRMRWKNLSFSPC